MFKKNSDLWFILVEHEIIVFEHEIRRRPTDRREVIKRIFRVKIHVKKRYSLIMAHYQREFSIRFIISLVGRRWLDSNKALSLVIYSSFDRISW